MRVLHIGKFYPPCPGGMERFLGDLTEAQVQQGLVVAVLVHQHEPLDSQSPATAYLLERVPVVATLAFAPLSPAFPFRLARMIRQFRPDVLHLHVPNVSAFWALLLPAARALPWVVHWHSDVVASRFSLALRVLYPFYRPFERALLKRAGKVIASSIPYQASSIPLREVAENTTVIPLGVQRARLPEVLTPQKWPLAGGGLKLLAVGRLTYYKGFDTLIRAMCDCPEHSLVIVGAGELRQELEQLVESHQLGGRVLLAGGLPDQEVLGLLATCDLFCLPSRERTEAFGIVLMEAMRYAKPCLVSNLPGSGMTWVVQDGVHGRHVPLDEPHAWATAIQELAAAVELRRQYGLAGQQRFERDFDIQAVAARVQGVYEELLAPNRDPGKVKAGTLVVIPALNEEESIGEVVREVIARGYPVLVVDDGSTDGTAKLAAEAGAVVLSPALNQGAWGAMQTGIRYALQQGYGSVVTMDADGQHEPEYLEVLIYAGAEQGGAADVVIGAYPQRGSPARQLAWRYFRWLTGFALEDLTSGFRYYSRPACQVLAGEEATLLDYQDVGVLLLLRRAGMHITEIPVSMNVRRSGISRIFFSWTAVLRYMAETTLLCLSRWGGRSKNT